MNKKELTPKLTRLEIKEKILSAAIIEFSQNSFSGTSTQAIAKRAGLKKSQLHYYIEDKEALYSEVLECLFKSWRDAFTFDKETEKGPIESLRNYIFMKLEFAFQHPELSRVFTSEILSGGQRLEAFWPNTVHSTTVNVEIINKWIETKQIRPLDGRLLLMNIWALTQYYADYALQAERILERSLQDPIQQKEIHNELTTFILLGCGLPNT
jgi:TetR/AcrR family transcriptional regulator